MYLFGSFVTKRKQKATVRILTKTGNQQVEIGARGGAVFFTADPVEIRSEINDSLDPLLRSSASIRLRTRGFIPELYAASALDVKVNIHLDGVCLFAGYVVPQSYSQPFANVYDELEINCIDALSALQYSNYRGIGTSAVAYEDVKAEAEMRTFADILKEAIGSAATGLDLTGANRTHRILFDSSLATSRPLQPLFNDIAISELLFLGKSEDETWTRLEVVEEIMRYLNLRMVQQGMDFKAYSIDTLREDADNIGWRTLDGTQAGSDFRDDVTITTAIAIDTDANVSVGEVYNRIELTCKVEETDTLIESPLDSETLYSPFTNRQLYVRELIVEGNSMDDFNDFRLISEGKISKGESKVRDWYMQVYDSRNWTFRGIYGDMVAALCGDNANQQRLPNMLSKTPGGALIAMGKVERNSDGKDNSLKGKIDMTTSLVVSVRGNGQDTASATYPTSSSILQGIPVARYTGSVSGGVFSPGDEETTNYIVFTGSIALQPLPKESIPDGQQPWITGAGDEAWNHWLFSLGKDNYGNLVVPSKNNKKGRFYGTQWFKAATPTADPVMDTSLDTPYLYPLTDDVPGQYEFKYSAIGDRTDTISKVAVLACMLVIGDKCVVETGSSGGVSDFVWKPFKTREQCADDDEYYSQSFTLGFDPKIGDMLIGPEYDLQNNIDHRLGLDMEGTAIPIRHTDKVSGKVSFQILGPVYTVWDEVTRRHKTWFRSVAWGSKSVPLLAHVSNIYVKDFKAQVVSDNGLVNNADNSDLIYVSDTDEDFVNVKGDLSFRITTALTREERVALGFTDSMKLSAPVQVSTGVPLLAIRNTRTGEEGKPEQLYVDSLYRALHKPRVELIHKLRESASTVRQFNRYTHPALPGKKFYVCGISRGLADGWAELNLKEISND